MKKKAKTITITTILLLSSLLVVFSAGPVQAAGDPVVFHMVPSKTSIKVGETFIVTQYVETGTIDNEETIGVACEYEFTDEFLWCEPKGYADFDWGNLFSAGRQGDLYPRIFNWNDTWGQGLMVNGSNTRASTSIPAFSGNTTVWSFEFTARNPGTAHINYTNLESYDPEASMQSVSDTGDLTIDIRYGDEPVFSSISPENTTGDTPHNHADLSASISDGDSGNTIQWWINTTPYIGSNSGSYTDGSGSQSVSCPINSFPSLAYNTNYSWTIEAYDGYYHTSESYWFVTRPQHLVTPPTGFGATATNKNTIQITWSSQGENSTDVWVEAQQGSYPASRGSGDENWNVTGGFNHDGLNPEEDWYYRAWSYDSTDNVWSTTYSQDMATTPANSPISIASPSPSNGSTNMQVIPTTLSVALDDPENSITSWSIETVPNIGSSSGGGEGTKTCSITPEYGNSYTWYVNATDDESTTSRAWYTFDTTQSPTVDNSSLTVSDGSTLNPGMAEAYWNITIEDPEGDAFDWDISCTNGDSTSGNDETNGTKSLHITGLSYGTTYTVTVMVEDTTGSYTYINYDYTFSTEDNLPPQAINPNPANGATGVPEGSLTWNCTLIDYEGEDITQYSIECSNGEAKNGYDGVVGTPAPGPMNVTLDLTGITDGMTYTIWVNTSTAAPPPAWGGAWEGFHTFTFTSGTGPNLPATLGTPSPTNGSIDQDLVFQWSIPIDDDEDDDVSYSIECSNGQTGSDTATSFPADGQLSLTGLAYSTSYTIWVNATDAGNGTTVREWFTFDTKNNVAPTIGTPSPANNSENNSNSLTWQVPISDSFSGSIEDDDLDWTIECPGINSDSGNDETYGTKGILLSGLAPDTWYTVYVNVSDGSLATNEWFTFHVANNSPPTIESPFPADSATDVTISLNDLNIYINDTDGDAMNYQIEGDFLTTASGTGVSDGQRTASVNTFPLTFDTTYTWYVNATDPSGSDTWTNETFTFTTETFDAPSGFTATTVDRTTINVTWTQASHAENTYVYRKVGSYPADRTDGTLVYDGSLYGFVDTGLEMDTTYYYRAWSYDAGSDTYSSTYAEDNTATDPNNIPDVDVRPNGTDTDVTTVLGGLVNYSDADGDQISITIYAGANWSARHTLATITDYDGETTFTSPQMPYDSTIHMWINITDGYDWQNDTYTFNTGSEVASGNITLYYNNSTKTGYNFVALLNESISTAEISAVLTQYNVTDEFEYFVQWDPVEQEYGDAYYIGMPGAIDLTFEAGDVVLISVRNNTTMDSAGYAPSMEWQDIPLYMGYNWLGRTNQTTSAYELATAINADGANWTQMLTWNAEMQQWGSSYLPAYVGDGAGSPWNFAVDPGETVLISTSRADSFSMYGW